jgi:hypothetical protein
MGVEGLLERPWLKQPLIGTVYRAIGARGVPTRSALPAESAWKLSRAQTFPRAAEPNAGFAGHPHSDLWEGWRAGFTKFLV